MLQLYVTIQTLTGALLQRGEQVLTKARDDRGSVTLEQVVITAAITLAAVAAVALIVARIQTETAKI